MLRVDVKPEMLRWARERADASIEELRKRFPKLEAWERGEAKPTLKQLEEYAKATFAPFGYFFYPEPPDEPLPIPDYRTTGGRRVARPSVNLLDTVYLCQRRQDWYSDFARLVGEERLAFVGSAELKSNVETTANAMRKTLGFDLGARRAAPNWSDALRLFIEQADAIGVLVMCSGVVQNNNRRRLDPDEFRGFALSDELAPVVFINGADTRAAQMFTLAHELAHLWIGRSGISDAQASIVPEQKIEQWCNRVAAELLVPLHVLKAEYRSSQPLAVETRRLAGRFKVSTLVILRRIHDAGGLSRDQFDETYESELARLRALMKQKGGGNFYLTLGARVSKRFARALVVSTFEGQTLFTEAFRLLGVKNTATLRELGHSLGVGV